MVIITITEWRKKLAFFLIGAVLVVVFAAGITWVQGTVEQTTVLSPEDLKKDVLSQPVKVQGPSGDFEEKKEGPQKVVPQVEEQKGQ